MNKELNQIKDMLNSAPKKGRKRLYISMTFFVPLIVGVLLVKDNGDHNYSCHISAEQKEFIKAHIERIADTGKVSKYMLYRHLKKRLKYETISKMPCHKFDTAGKFLDKYEQHINLNK